MRSGCCKHFNGSYHNTHCDAGVCYRDVTPKPDEPGSAIRQPCRKPDDDHDFRVLAETGPQGVCNKYEEPTQEEIAADEAAWEAAKDRMFKSIPWTMKIKEANQGKNASGTDECPICGNVIHWSCAGAYNGHVHARCETENCLNFME